jgi:hypothetical protein
MVEMRIKDEKKYQAQSIRPSLWAALAAVASAVGTISGVAYGEPAKPARSSTGPASKATATRNWTMEELLPPQSLNATKTESVSGWSERHATGVMTKMTSSQSGKNQALKGFFDRQSVVSERDQKIRLAALKDVKQQKFQEQGELSRYLLNQLGKALGDHARESSEFLRTLGQGLSFKVDGKGVAANNSGSGGNSEVRYGLILKKVKPSGQGVHVAALTMDESYLEYALASKKKAQVDWTIGPISERNENLLFPGIDNPALLDAPRAPKAQGLFAMRPDFSLRGKIEPNFNAESAGKPGFRLRFEQPQGLYRMEMLTGGGPKRNQLMHEVRLPVYGNFVVMRQLNSTMEATKTSLLNVFGFSEILGQYPLNVHYVHSDYSLRAETGFGLINGRLGIEANMTNLRDKHANSKGSYAVNYGRGF